MPSSGWEASDPQGKQAFWPCQGLKNSAGQGWQKGVLWGPIPERKVPGGQGTGGDLEQSLPGGKGKGSPTLVQMSRRAVYSPLAILLSPTSILPPNSFGANLAQAPYHPDILVGPTLLLHRQPHSGRPEDAP